MPDVSELSESRRALFEKYVRGRDIQPSREASAIPRRAVRDSAPLSSGQQQLWLLNELLPDTPIYTECVTIHLPGTLDIPILEHSFNELLRRHEAWRSSFPVVDGLPVQRIHPDLKFSLPVVDLRHLPDAEREPEAQRMMTDDAQRPFDLANGPLVRPTLMRLGEADHRLFLTLHHIIFDGFSLYQIFLPELRILYEAYLAGQASSLPELPIQYADFAIWQREWLQRETLSDQLDYWKRQLTGFPATLELPTDHPRPPISTYRGLMHPFVLSKELTDKLKDLAGRENVTLYMMLVAAFQTLLYRYTQQDDILLGTAISGRKQPEVQKLMGFFLNTLILRTDLSGNPTFHELLKRVRDVVLEAHAHQDVPFEYLVKALQPERNLSQNPLFQAMLSLEPPITIHPSGWTLTQMDVETNTTKFDLAIELDDRPEGLIGRFEYSTDLFDSPTIARMAGHWQQLLESIVADPEEHIAALPILTKAERRQLLEEWNTTQTAYPPEVRIHALFADQVERTPDAIALVFEGCQMTYRELNAKANQLASRLQQLGVGSEVLVGLCMERSCEMVIGLLGILKAGGAYLPLDPTYPVERLTFMLQDAQVSVLLTQPSLRGQFTQIISTVLCSDTDWSNIADTDTDNLFSAVQADQLAYVIYTSGSTGRPKGVMVTHHNLWHSTQARLSYYHEPVQCFLLLSSIAFDSSVAGVFWTLCQGGTLLLPGETVFGDPHQLSKLIEEQHVSHLLCVPSLYSLLLTQLDAAQRLGSLTTVIAAGERCPAELVEHHADRLPRCALFNEYGPTEASVWSTVYDCVHHCDAQESYQSIPIGRPIANMQAYILDSCLQPVPIGVPGELYLGGEGITRGYLHQQELTAERFIAHPFSSKLGERLYKTGDLVRYLPDGNIEFLGRLDHQVKIRGFRIELGEIEETLLRHPVVREAVVVVREDRPGDTRLVAYLVPGEQQAPSTSDLHYHLEAYLPLYMIPSVFILLKELPVLPNGKVDRRGLPAPDQTQAELEENYVAPRTPEEESVAKIWRQVLNIERVGVHDNFFRLGGHSLLVTQVISQLRASLQVEVSMRQFFGAPTVAQLAGIIQQRETDQAHRQRPTLRAIPRETHRMPLSSLSPTATTRESNGSHDEQKRIQRS